MQESHISVFKIFLKLPTDLRTKFVHADFKLSHQQKNKTIKMTTLLSSASDVIEQNTRKLVEFFLSLDVNALVLSASSLHETILLSKYPHSNLFNVGA